MVRLDDELSKRNSTGLLPSTGGGIAETSALPEPRGFHNAPRRQFVAVLKGGLEMETGDGTKITVLPGEVFLVQDRPAFIILPEAKPTGQPMPWVWYAPTLPGLPGAEEKWMFERFTQAGSQPWPASNVPTLIFG